MIAALLCSVLGETPKPGAELEFWVGSWNVYVEGKLVGKDVVTKSQKGFAITEDWTDASGETGKSLFYYMPVSKRWKQVWVTEAGVYKEKLSEPCDGGIRFSGQVFLPDGRKVRDRTTLTRLQKDEVHQVIEFTRDGKAWQVSFDAVYRRA